MATNYQSITIDHAPTGDNDVGNNSSRRLLDAVTKRHIVVGVLAMLVVGAVMVASGHTTNTPSGSTSTSNYYPSYFFWGGGRDEGRRCFNNDQCTSGKCAKSGLFAIVGVCLAEDGCLHDRHCEMFVDPEPGYFLPKSTCNPDTEKCSIWRYGKPLDEKGYPILKPEGDVIWIPRDVRDSDLETPLIEQVWHFDLGGQPDGTEIIVNETHVHLPFLKHIFGGYSRVYKALEEHETGAVSLEFTRNPISVLSPLVVAGLFEKYHALTFEGEWNEENVDAAHAEVAARTPEEQAKAENDEMQTFRDRNYALMFDALKLGDRMMEGSMDYSHLQQLRDLLYGRTEDEATAAAAEMHAHPTRATRSEEATTALGMVHPDVESMKTEHHCKHFEPMDGMELTADHLVFPLNKELITLSGVTAYVPRRRFGVSAGKMIVTHNAETNSIEFYFHGLQQTHINVGIPESDLPNAIFVSPVDPELYPLTEYDGRTDKFYATDFTSEWGEKAVQTLYNNIMSVPLDYSRFDKTNDEACSQERFCEVAPYFKGLEMSEGFEALATIPQLLDVMSEGIDCATSYLRPEKYRDAAGYSFLVQLAWIHSILETDKDSTLEFSTATYWDDWKDIKNSHTYQPTEDKCAEPLF